MKKNLDTDDSVEGLKAHSCQPTSEPSDRHFLVRRGSPKQFHQVDKEAIDMGALDSHSPSASRGSSMDSDIFNPDPGLHRRLSAPPSVSVAPASMPERPRPHQRFWRGCVPYVPENWDHIVTVALTPHEGGVSPQTCHVTGVQDARQQNDQAGADQDRRDTEISLPDKPGSPLKFGTVKGGS